MRTFLALALVALTPIFSVAQQTEGMLPHHLTQEEADAARAAGYVAPASRGITTPPDYPSIRSMAEWEEIQALVIGWQGFPGILKRITAAAKEECEVIILSEDPAETITYLQANNAGGPLNNLDNVTVLNVDLNSIWIRDYAGKSVYANEVEDLFMVDWIYNRPRPLDDVSPEAVAEYLDLELYATTAPPYDLMGTGGNFMSDGFGTGFSSELIVDENSGGGTWWGTPYPSQGETGVRNVMNQFLGIDEYVLMTNLPYDGIHHIDMHMKLLDEETLLVAEYPEGVADGPQIKANIDYVLSNYTTKWGTPFRVIRVPSPPQLSNGQYPDQGGWYKTYTNSLFVNNTLLVPTYYQEYDTTALRIIQDAMPGYNVVGINCGVSPNNIIQLSGALHCITHEVGANDPLLISHQPLRDTDDNLNDYQVTAYMNHRAGVVSAMLHYKTQLDGAYEAVAMTPAGDNNWQAFIPAQPHGTRVYYYVEGEAADGKVQVRPMPAPEGYWAFDVTANPVGIDEQQIGDLNAVYPNPATAITCVPLKIAQSASGNLRLMDLTGRTVDTLFEGVFPTGEQKYFFNAAQYAPGVYLVVLEVAGSRFTQRVVVQ